MDQTTNLPDEILAEVLSPRRMRPSDIGSARLVCRRWGVAGGDVLARERRRIAAEACAPGGTCTHQWTATAALVNALVDDSIPMLLRVMDTDIVGPNDPIDVGGWRRLGVGVATVDIALVHGPDDRNVGMSPILAEDDLVMSIPPLVVTPLVMAFAYGALRCARALIGLGAYPMPHVDALVSFVIELCAWNSASVVAITPGDSTAATPRPRNNIAVVMPRRPMDIAPALRLILDAFPRDRRTPSGIVPPLHALVRAATDASLMVAEEGLDETMLADAVLQVAHVLLDAGYNPRAPWRCRGPYEMSRVYLYDRRPATINSVYDARLAAIDQMTAETPYDAALRTEDRTRSRPVGQCSLFDALAEAYATHGAS
ncbi:F-box incomplete domain containing protein [Pandoravirus celtis]|uniref:F-box incomplete domain containing protein n=1 Tax=Pandoravirus celtis TaxID=2568002 RepID=A0A4D6EHZ4_9VIRU|nr:F-box incomplete domain containing protein [Pandoravirus celtis]